MPLDHKLKRWTDAKFISPEQAQRIRAFEKDRERPTLVQAISGLAALAVAIGLVSIVAANWDLIPGRMKLVLDAIVVVALGQGVVQLRSREPSWLEEVALVAYHGLVLASIALVGQVYQLGGSAAQALLVWSVLTLPMMALARSPRIGLLWVVGLEVSYFVALSDLAGGGQRQGDHALAAVYFAPLALFAVGQSSWLRRRRPAYAQVLRGAAWVQLVLMGSLASFAFYDALARAESTPWLVVGVSLLGTAWLCLASEGTPAGRSQRYLLAVTFAASHLPVFMPHGKWPVGAAAAFIVIYTSVALLAHRKGRPGLLHLATAVIALRLIVIYFEVFGTLLDTGVGLVVGGLLTLFLTWVWARKRRDFDRELSARGTAP